MVYVLLVCWDGFYASKHFIQGEYTWGVIATILTFWFSLRLIKTMEEDE